MEMIKKSYKNKRRLKKLVGYSRNGSVDEVPPVKGSRFEPLDEVPPVKDSRFQS